MCPLSREQAALIGHNCSCISWTCYIAQCTSLFVIKADQCMAFLSPVGKCGAANMQDVCATRRCHLIPTPFLLHSYFDRHGQCEQHSPTSNWRSENAPFVIAWPATAEICQRSFQHVHFSLIAANVSWIPQIIGTTLHRIPCAAGFRRSRVSAVGQCMCRFNIFH